MVILAIVGLALTRTLDLAGDVLRSPENRESGARSRSRSASTALSPISEWSKRAAESSRRHRHQIEVRVPYAMGVVCGPVQQSYTHISLLPVDSAMYAAPGYSGFAWRGGDGVYRYKEDNQTKEVGTLTICNDAQIGTLTAQGAKVIKLTPALARYRQLRHAGISVPEDSILVSARP